MTLQSTNRVAGGGVAHGRPGYNAGFCKRQSALGKVSKAPESLSARVASWGPECPCARVSGERAPYDMPEKNRRYHGGPDGVAMGWPLT